MVLSLKSCKLRQLGDDVAELGCLKELYLETNLILSLPQNFTRLRALEVTDHWIMSGDVSVAVWTNEHEAVITKNNQENRKPPRYGSRTSLTEPTRRPPSRPHSDSGHEEEPPAGLSGGHRQSVPLETLGARW